MGRIVMATRGAGTPPLPSHSPVFKEEVVGHVGGGLCVKLAVLLLFHCGGGETGERRGREMDSAPQPSMLTRISLQWSLDHCRTEQRREGLE